LVGFLGAGARPAQAEPFVSLHTDAPGVDSGVFGLAFFQPIDTDSFGTLGLGYVMLNFGLDAPLTSASLQLAPAGTEGAELFDLVSETGGLTGGTFSFRLGALVLGVILSGPATAELEELLQSGLVSVNVKTDAFPAGETGGTIFDIEPLMAALSGEGDADDLFGLIPGFGGGLGGLPSIPGLPTIPGSIPNLPGTLPLPF